MSAASGSLKVTRCTSKPAPPRRFSSTASAPASAGVTDGQRSRSRAMERAERASVMPSLNMRPRRWASTVGHKFQLALLVPTRGSRWLWSGWRQRIRSESVGSAGPLPKHQLEKAPQIEADRDQQQRDHRIRIFKAIRDCVEQSRSDEKGDDPPTAFIAIVKPLDRGGRQEPDAENENRCSGSMEYQGNQRRMRRGAGVPEACAKRERRRIVEDVKDVGADVDGFDVSAKDSADNKCQHQHKNETENPAGENGIPIFEAVDAPFGAEQKPVVRQFVHRPPPDGTRMPPPAGLVVASGRRVRLIPQQLVDAGLGA